MPRPPVPLLLLSTLLLCAALALTLARPARGAERSPSSPGPAGGGHDLRWRWPVRGAVVRRFRLAPDPFARGQHRGITLAAPPGTAVAAVCAGTVRFAGTVGASGRTVTLGCGALNATLTRLGTVLVHRGTVVVAGEDVARVGAAGAVQLGARIRGRRFGYLDPLSLLADDPAPPLGPAPPPARRRPPSAPPPPSVALLRAPAPAHPGLPLAAGWLPVGLGLLGACGLFTLRRPARTLVRTTRRGEVDARDRVDAI